MATNRYWSVSKVRKQRYQYRAIGRDTSYFDKNLSKSNNKYKQDEIIQMLDLFNRQHICPVWWTGISTNNWYSNGYKLCSATHRFVSVYL
jgi:hypothetical protein